MYITNISINYSASVVNKDGCATLILWVEKVRTKIRFWENWAWKVGIWEKEDNWSWIFG